MNFFSRLFGRPASPAVIAVQPEAPAAPATRDYSAGVTYRSALEQLVIDRGGHWDRTTEDNGATVVIRLHQPGGDVIVARGPTTDDARKDLVHRLALLDAASVAQ